MQEITPEQLKEEYFESIIQHLQDLNGMVPTIQRDWKDDKGYETLSIIQDLSSQTEEFFQETFKLFFYLQEIERVGDKFTSWRGELNSLGGFASINQIADLINKKIGRLTDMNSMP